MEYGSRFEQRPVLINRGSFFLDTKDGVRKEVGIGTSIEVNIEQNYLDYNMTGDLVDHRRATTYKISGTIGHYSCTSYFLDIFEEYKKTGSMPKVSCIGTVEDSSSTSGRRSVLVTGIQFDGAALFRLGTSQEFAEDEIEFQASGWERLEDFTTFDDQI